MNKQTKKSAATNKKVNSETSNKSRTQKQKEQLEQDEE